MRKLEYYGHVTHTTQALFTQVKPISQEASRCIFMSPLISPVSDGILCEIAYDMTTVLALNGYLCKTTQTNTHTVNTMEFMLTICPTSK